MKRSPLKRKTPLARGGSLKRTAAPRDAMQKVADAVDAIVFRKAYDLMHSGGSLKRSAMKRQPMKRYRKPSAVAQADALAAAIVHARGCCAVAESSKKTGHSFGSCLGRLQQHHARGRRRGFRWRTESHLLLCLWHHTASDVMSAHGTPYAFAKWVRQYHPEIAAMPNVPETAEAALERLRNTRGERTACPKGNDEHT